MAGICKVLVANRVRSIWGLTAPSQLAREPWATSLPKRRANPPLVLVPSSPLCCGCCLFKGLPLPLSLLPPSLSQPLLWLRAAWGDAAAGPVSWCLASVLCPSRHGLHSWLHRLHLLHWLSSAYTQFAVPYFIYDIYAMFLCHWHKHQVKGHGDEAGAKAPGSTWAVARGYLHKEFLMVLHHAVMVLVCFPLSVVWRQGKGDFFLGCLLMAEVSTPFVCLGKILIQYKQQHTLLHKVNGALMLLSFLCCRVLLFPYLYWAYGRHAGLPLFAVPLAIPAHVNLGAALLLAPQLYWFFLICRGACRLFRPRGTPPPSPCQTKD
ncbi:ceramide synthase isoform X1 [Equus asinus]|uniref:ceramide synthase isoform X1 n=1 Tax=Equus asinus TaxID=9793 RepID=UPI0038F67172